MRRPKPNTYRTYETSYRGNVYATAFEAAISFSQKGDGFEEGADGRMPRRYHQLQRMLGHAGGRSGDPYFRAWIWHTGVPHSRPTVVGYFASETDADRWLNDNTYPISE
jgi:hypothetical protein